MDDGKASQQRDFDHAIHKHVETWEKLGFLSDAKSIGVIDRFTCSLSDLIDRLGKADGSDGEPVEVWKVMGNCGVNWLTQFFNRVTIEAEGDASECSNYRGIKLISHTMKVYKRLVDSRLREMVTISQEQWGFMPERGDADDIALVADGSEELEENVQLWQGALADNGLRLNVRKTKFISSEQCTEPILDSHGEMIEKVKVFHYLENDPSEERYVDQAVRKQINAALLK
ncbi:unnamed protein product [Heligmosomoides polygyrus]|uniref:Reverse transcriptase domain-containing protein n=1 Tax=Heligmosomoides polygyrus TaxID=6339 RepID=A0A183FL96_HELPZ|nr:unnamed protein product [Heligmosomoides polygyrus]